MAEDMWDWLVPNLAGETNAKVAPTRDAYAGKNGRLDPNAITRETLQSYGVPSGVTDDAAPYLSTYKMNNDLTKSALTPPERTTGETIGGLLQALAIPVSYAQGNKGFGSQLFGDNIMTRDAARKSKYEDASREGILKNAQNLTSNVDSIIAQQQKMRAAAKAESESRTNRENVADRYSLDGDQRMGYVLNGKFEPGAGQTDDIKEYQYAVQNSGFKGSFTDFMAAKKSTSGNPAAYKLNPDGTQTFVPGGPADPKTVSALSEARGRGSMNVPQNVRAAGIQADQSYTQLSKALDDYADLVDGKLLPDGSTDGSGTGRVAIPGVDMDKVLGARRGIQLQLKELFNLGVLNGPDLALMDTMLFDPNVSIDPRTWSNAINTGSRARSSVANLKEQLRDIRNSKTRVIGMDDIGPDGKPIPGTGQRTSTAQVGADGTSTEGQAPPPAADYSGLSDEDLLRELEGRGVAP